MKGVHILKEGIIWRVGNGEKINIWTDPWIPRGTTRKVVTPKGQNLLRNVSELIDPSTGSWDYELLEQTFWGEDNEIIKSIPVHQDMDDVVAWHFDTRGIFSVRSAYKIHRVNSWMASGRGASSSHGRSDAEEGFWRKLWKLACPGKIKHFLWRLGHNTLAMRTTLSRRGMDLDTRCVVCERLDEDGGHLFCKCKYVKQLWQELNLEHVRLQMAERTSAKEMLRMIWELEEKECILVVTTLWHWWLERNRIRGGEKRRGVGGLAFEIRFHTEEYLKLAASENPKPPMTLRRWTKPGGEVLKINSDGAFDPVTRSGGWGFVIRDSEGTAILSGFRSRCGVTCIRCFPYGSAGMPCRGRGQSSKRSWNAEGDC